MIANQRPSVEHPNVAQSRLISRTWDGEANCEFIAASIPSRQDSEVRYLIQGHTHGRDASCSCLGWKRWGHCCHEAAFVLIVEELERQHYADERRYSTTGLLALARHYDNIADILSPDQRLRFQGVKAALLGRGVRFASTRTLAEQSAAVARGKRAVADLFDE